MMNTLKNKHIAKPNKRSELATTLLFRTAQILLSCSSSRTISRQQPVASPWLKVLENLRQKCHSHPSLFCTKKSNVKKSVPFQNLARENPKVSNIETKLMTLRIMQLISQCLLISRSWSKFLISIHSGSTYDLFLKL